MALSANPFPKESLTGFLGVNLRLDGLTLADEDVMRAINADFHTQPGVMQLRAGRALLNATNLGSAVRTLARHNSRRYQVAGTVLYRDWASILTGLNGTTLLTTLHPGRPLNDTTTWSFIADQALMRKDDGTTVHVWGIVAPSGTPTLAVGAAGSLTGDYRARYTYARVVGSAVAHESNPCPAPTAVALTADRLNIPVVASADPQVTHIRVYRTVADGSAYLFDQQVANTTATVVSTQLDSALGAALETDNDPPPEAAWVTEFQGHFWLCQDADFPHYLWYSKRFRPESWPTSQFLEMGDPSDPLQCAVPMTGLLGVFARRTKYRVFGNSVAGFSFLEALNTRGTPAPQAVLASTLGVAFVARDGLFVTNFAETDRELSQAIQALFYGETVNSYSPIDWAQTAAMSLTEWKRRLYFGYQDTAGTRMLAVYSLDTQRWYHYQHPVHRLLVEEDTDQLTMGDSSGRVWVLESGTADDTEPIALTSELAVRSGGDRFTRKPMRWLSVDCDATGGTWSLPLYVDGTLVQTFSVEGSRRKRLLPITDDTMGYTWQVRPSCTGRGTAALYAVEVLDTGPPDGQVWIADPADTSRYLAILPAQQGADLFSRKQFMALRVDGEVSTAGTWTLDVYLDDTLQHTFETRTTRDKRFLRFPSKVHGYTWRVVATYSSTSVPQLYAVQPVDTGEPDGQVWVMDPTAQDTFLNILPPRQPVDRFPLKRLLYLKLDAEAGAGTWTLALFVDGARRWVGTVSGNRNQQLIRLPDRLLGHTWYVEAQYSLSPTPQLYAVDVQFQVLRAS